MSDRTDAGQPYLAERSRLLPWVTSILVFAGCFASWRLTPVHFALDLDPELRPSLAVIAVVASLAGLATWYAAARGRNWPLYTIAAVGWLLFTMIAPLVAASAYAGLAPRNRVHAAVYFGVTIGLVGVPLMMGATRYDRVGGILPALVTFAMVVILPYLLGSWLRTRREMLAALAERAERAERMHAERLVRARAEERARIAREMHDVIAHQVSIMVLHAGALEMKGDPQTAEQAELIRRAGRVALTELRTVLGLLREPEGADRLAPPPAIADVEPWVIQAREAGLPVTFRREGTRRPVTASVAMTGHRIVQEALTNVFKHAGHPETSVVVRYRPDHVDVTIDNGPPDGTAPQLPTSGLGLVGLAERLELLGGVLKTGDRPDGGFTLYARIPTPADEENQ